jgi:prophage antirepressor-like protein/DNA-binding MarR family transcriptional regulator
MSHVPAVQTFQYQLYNVRVIEKDGQPWFNEADVKRVLGMHGRQYGRRLLDSEKGTSIFGTLGGPQQMTILSESGVYKLIMRSTKEEAEPFQNWVAQEVLPAIRKTRTYTHQPAITTEHAMREKALFEMDFELRASVIFGIPPVCALQEGVKRVQRELGVDMSEYLKRSPLAKAEQRILSVIKKHGTLTVRDIQRWTKLAYADITPHLETLMTAGVVVSDTTSRTTKYRYVQPGEESQSM